MVECGRGEPDNWISPDMIEGYGRLHDAGLAHSAEIWDVNGRLVGGAYGVRVGKVFSGESMFRKESNASRIAVLALAARFRAVGGEVIDVQVESPHTVEWGARPISCEEFLTLSGCPNTATIPRHPSQLPDLL